MKSAAQYFCRPMQEYVAWSKMDVPPNVLLAMSKAIRSIERGKGAASLKDCFKMEDFKKIGDFRKDMPETD